MILSTEETWATNTLRDAQDPGASTRLWKPLSKLTLERYNLIFAQAHSRGYAADGQPEHDCGTVLENSANTLFKVALNGGDLLLTKWSVGNDPEAAIDDAVVVADAVLSDTARPSIELVAGVNTTVRIFYVDEDDDKIHYVNSADSGDNFAAEADVGDLADVKAIASVSTARVHCISYTDGNTRFHCYDEGTPWTITNSLIYWPHEVDHIDAITIGDRDLIVFYSLGPVYGVYREAGIYGIWYKNGRWSDLFKIDVVGEATDYSYRQHPMISTANSIYFLTLVASEGDSQYSQALRALKTSKDGRYWSQYQPLVTCAELGPAKLLAIDAETDGTWPWSDGLQTYVVGYDKIYESDSTRLVGEDNSDLQVDITSRTPEWRMSRGVIAQGSALVFNGDGALDAHAIINADNTLLLTREAGYYTGAGAEYAELTLEQVDFFKETDRLPRRHKNMVSRDLMSWMRDKQAKHTEEWVSQLIGYDNYDDSGITGRGGMSHTITKKGRWEAAGNVLWLKSDNEEGVAFTTWGSHIMNGQVKDMIRIETEGNDEYAGVVFRALDEGNFWSAYYDQATDKIVLRQKVGGEWQASVAQSAALSWADDTWYGVMVDFRYSYIRVYYSADGLTWTAALTHTLVPNPALPAPEYGYVGTVGYGYSDQDTDHAPGYTPPVLPPPVTPPTMGDGNKGYFCDATSGRFFRVESARAADPTAVVYFDLGVIDAGGIRHFALDSWDPRNSAMACGDNGVWKTTNLNDAVPTWTLVFDGTVAGHLVMMVASSICRKDLWMFIARHWNAGQGAWFAYPQWTIDGGTNWTMYSGLPDNGPWDNTITGDPKIELSSHDEDTAWVTAIAGGDEVVFKTTDMWTGHTQTAILGVHAATVSPHSYHRYFDNPNDLHSLYGSRSGTANNEAAVTACSNDAASCACEGQKVDVGVSANCHWVGGYTWGTNRYWLLKQNTAPAVWVFMVADIPCGPWTLQYTFSGTTQWISGWPREGERFYATQNGLVAPLLVSDDRGLTWQAQTGNWAALAYNGNITCFVPVWTE